MTTNMALGALGLMSYAVAVVALLRQRRAKKRGSGVLVALAISTSLHEVSQLIPAVHFWLSLLGSAVLLIALTPTALGLNHVTPKPGNCKIVKGSDPPWLHND